MNEEPANQSIGYERNVATAAVKKYQEWLKANPEVRKE